MVPRNSRITSAAIRRGVKLSAPLGLAQQLLAGARQLAASAVSKRFELCAPIRTGTAIFWRLRQHTVPACQLMSARGGRGCCCFHGGAPAAFGFGLLKGARCACETPSRYVFPEALFPPRRPFCASTAVKLVARCRRDGREHRLLAASEPPA